MRSRNDKHYMFTWPCGCPFSVMTEELALDAVWLEAFESEERVEAARKAGVKLHRIAWNEWDEVHQAKFGKCDHEPPTLPQSPPDFDADAAEMVIENRVNDGISAYFANVEKCRDELTVRIARLLKAEEPFDVRLAVDEIVKALSEALEVAS